MFSSLESHVIEVGFNVIKEAKEGGEFSPKKTTSVKDTAIIESPDIYAEKLMKVYRQFYEVVEKAFKSNPLFSSALDKVR